jgi:hypothetical protein
MARMLAEGRPVDLRGEESSGRMGVRLQASLRAPGSWHRRIHAVIVDVGLAGMCAEVDDFAVASGPVFVETAVPDANHCCRLRGSIKWVRADVSPTRVGIILEDGCAWTWFATLKRIATSAARVGFAHVG